MKKLFAIVFLISLSACSLHADPGRTSIHMPGASIEMGGDDHHGRGFCPPGQAKKGNC